MNKDVLFKGNLKEGIYKLIKTTNGWVLEGEDIAYAGFNVTDRPQGEWICKGDWAECSLCGADSGTIMNGLERVPRYTRFCPECGARMKGADDD